MNNKTVITKTIKVAKPTSKLVTRSNIRTQPKQEPVKKEPVKETRKKHIEKSESKLKSIAKPKPINIKKGLLIGLNYVGTASELSGCINDTDNLKNLLTSKNYFKDNELILMRDGDQGDLHPTKANIMKQLANLVTFANNNKNNNVLLFVAYSGHGSYVADKNGDEADRRDEVICPLDFQTAGFIVDDNIRKLFIDKLPANVKLVMLFDSCFSGTVCDLKYAYKVDTNNTVSAAMKLSQTKCSVVMISGCRDTQTSADAYEVDPTTNAYEYQGAMSASFIANYNNNITYNQLITNMRTWLKLHQYTQVPQLTTGKLVNIDSSFLLNSFI